MSRRVATELIVWHCSATPPSRDIGRAEIDQMHKDRGWSGIGYHLVVRRDGRVEDGRALGDLGAHVKGYNSRSIGVVLVGGVTEDGEPENNFTPEQWQSIPRVMDLLRLMYPDARVVGHRDLSPDQNGDGVISSWEFVKACPSFNVMEIINGNY